MEGRHGFWFPSAAFRARLQKRSSRRAQALGAGLGPLPSEDWVEWGWEDMVLGHLERAFRMLLIELG